MTSLGSSTWGTGPTIGVSFSYDKNRNGSSMQYSVQIDLNPLTGSGYFGYPIYASISLDGSVLATTTIKNASPSQWSSALSYPSGWLTVANKTSGTTALVIRLYSGSGSSRDVSYSYSLPVDPAQSDVSCTQAEIGTPATIIVTRYSASFTHTLSYLFGSLPGTILTKTNQTTIPWTIPTDFYGQIPYAKTGVGTLICDTYYGDTLIGTSSCGFIATTSSAVCAPSVALDVKDINAAAIALTGDAANLIKHYSNAEATVMAVTKNSATIASIIIRCSDGRSASSSPATFNNIAGDTFTVTVTDSRGYSSEATVKKLIVEYIKLTGNASFYRTEPTTGEVSAELSGNYFYGSFGTASNTLHARIRSKITSNTEYGDWSDISSGITISGSTYHYSTTLTNFDYTKAYSFQINVYDALTDLTLTSSVSQGIPVFDWGEDDLNVNGTLKVNGVTLCGIAVGDILFSTLAANPATRYPGTAWVVWGAGKVPVGFDVSQAEFNAVEKTGGEKAHALITSEMPSHGHQGAISGTLMSWGKTTGGSQMRVNMTGTYGGSFTGGHEIGTDGAGDGTAHNNLQPYIVCYMWKRTA